LKKITISNGNIANNCVSFDFEKAIFFTHTECISNALHTVCEYLKSVLEKHMIE